VGDDPALIAVVQLTDQRRSSTAGAARTQAGTAGTHPRAPLDP
jgi:hypothetical protein